MGTSWLRLESRPRPNGRSIPIRARSRDGGMRISKNHNESLPFVPAPCYSRTLRGGEASRLRRTQATQDRPPLVDVASKRKGHMLMGSRWRYVAVAAVVSLAAAAC